MAKREMSDRWQWWISGCRWAVGGLWAVGFTRERGVGVGGIEREKVRGGCF